uniref:F-actin-capping protein subunit beta n=1 Tax=Canis lupus familiaris TaxID=9615 RepID=A0A8C0MKB1_CANLF
MHPSRRSLPFPLNCQLVRVGTADYGGASDQSDQQLDCALDLMRRLPPQQIEKNLSDLIDLVPSLCEDLLSSVDQPLKIARDKVVGKDYLLCDYNRDGDSYRSPWSNKYDPPLEDGAMPSARLRKLEVEANNAFDQYRDLYFEGGVSSVYLWDLDHGFAGVILIKKAGDGSKKIKGCWDSIHVVEVQEKSSGRTAHYKLTSTVMLWLQTNKSGSGTMNLGGSLTRQMEKDETVSDCSPHIANIGRLVEVSAPRAPPRGAAPAARVLLGPCLPKPAGWQVPQLSQDAPVGALGRTLYWSGDQGVEAWHRHGELASGVSSLEAHRCWPLVPECWLLKPEAWEAPGGRPGCGAVLHLPPVVAAGTAGVSGRWGGWAWGLPLAALT